MTLAHALDAPDVAQIVCEMWQRTSEQVSVIHDVVVHLPRLNRAELVLNDTSQLDTVKEQIDRLIDGGMHVNVLLPVGCLGDAHDQLRGRPLYLQGWIDRGDGMPRFVAPELA